MTGEQLREVMRGLSDVCAELRHINDTLERLALDLEGALDGES